MRALGALFLTPLLYSCPGCIDLHVWRIFYYFCDVSTVLLFVSPALYVSVLDSLAYHSILSA